MSLTGRFSLAVTLAAMLALTLGCNGQERREPEPAPDAEVTLPDQAAPDVPERFVVAISPSAESYEIPRDLGTVRNLAYHGDLTEQQKRQLARVGFVVAPDEAEQMFMLYESYTETDDAANFITVDSLLQAWHVFYDFSLRTVESEKLAPLAEQMTEALLQDAAAQLEAADGGPVREAASRNLGYLAVAQRLLDPAAAVPDAVRGVVEEELALIEAHGGFSASPIFGYNEDYSQYVPRGHYTRSEALERYFKAMMWYGRLSMLLKGGD